MDKIEHEMHVHELTFLHWWKFKLLSSRV